ncbi:hypothetical protein ACFQBQ_07765 [Granulicella cerasi]|uniref:SWIM-type domain-containing protein n=1 Tax=Granulicella cerasi TaxID=741063 RepID=A0ABW1Z8H5_9BACT|nr:hypothetical protein [Granulicella cerasi]
MAVTHGIEHATYYSNGERWVPAMECSCGFSTGMGHECWATVGEDFDAHLAEVMPKAEGGEQR